ncbi:MAG: sulfite oxidase [Methanomassiliicoccales archaeon]|nr:sulfite oxidase [Methanomassiliicoccales archaeon]NYT14377.1 sulfite oxidase [Methanomassiliicoccales archaeon]
MKDRFYFSTRDLVTIAILSALGGVLSTYIGYLGNLINTTLGVPFGAGQIMAGLHIFWMIVAYAIIPRFGTGTLVGLLKGTVELFAGSAHGVPIVLVSLVEGILVDMTFAVFRKPTTVSFVCAGALASASNVFVFQALYFASVPFTYILLIAAMAAISGAVFAGYFGQGAYQILVESGIVKVKGEKPVFKKLTVQKAFTIAVAVALIGGAVIYFTVVYKPFMDPLTCDVDGNVESPFVYRPADFADYEVTITAELIGEYTYVPPTEYTGVPLHIILERANPNSGASNIKVIASDGYEARFDYTDVMEDVNLILIQEDGRLRLIAGEYEGQYWVKKVSEIRVS